MRQARGFTLVELMIVVAIAGLLASIALTGLMRVQARAKVAEARLNLRAIHVAERSYFAERETYTSSVRALGFSPERGNRYYYQVGDSAQSCIERTGPIEGPRRADSTCLLTDRFRHPHLSIAALDASAAPVPVIPGIDGHYFAAATGNVDADPGTDTWIITSNIGLPHECVDDLRLTPGEPCHVQDDL